MRRKLLARGQNKCGHCDKRDKPCCEHCNTHGDGESRTPQDVSLEELLAFVEGTADSAAPKAGGGRTKKAKKKGKPRSKSALNFTKQCLQHDNGDRTTHSDPQTVVLESASEESASDSERHTPKSSEFRDDGHLCSCRETGVTDKVNMLTTDLDPLGGAAPAIATPAAITVPGPGQTLEIVAAVEAALRPKIEAMAAAIGEGRISHPSTPPDSDTDESFVYQPWQRVGRPRLPGPVDSAGPVDSVSDKINCPTEMFPPNKASSNTSSGALTALTQKPIVRDAEWPKTRSCNTASIGPALETRRSERDAEIAVLEARIAAVRAEQAADDELQRQWPRLSGTTNDISASQSWESAGKCCVSHECVRDGCTVASLQSDGQTDSHERAEGASADHNHCDCDCHAIAAAGREAVLAKLVQGVDFSPLFEQRTDADADLDAEQEQTLEDFERTLTRAHGWCAVAKACSTEWR